jgi:hypothetical protein
MSSEMSFWFDLLEVYRKNKRVIDRRLYLKDYSKTPCESRLFDFCVDFSNNLRHENLCHLALVFSNILGRTMPDHIHSRMILGEPNQWVKDYCEYVGNLGPRLFGVNLNRNNFRLTTLGRNGSIRKMMLK